MNSKLLHHALAGAALLVCAGHADAQNMTVGGKLLLTGGVNSIEGAAGGGLTPWAVIAGYGTRDQVGGNVFVTNVRVDDYQLRVAGAAVGLYDRVELSFAEQRFDTRDVGATLGLGHGFTFTQKVVGAKVKLFGDAVLEQDSPVPQVSVGVMRKDNDRGDLLRALGIRNHQGTEVYVSATKLFLDPGVLVNGTLRATKANQTGLLGFGTPTNNKAKLQFEGSVAYLLRRDLAIGAEIRTKPDRLAFKEERWADLFVAWSPAKNVSLTLAYVDLGNIVIKDRQRGTYLSFQFGF
ncbi:MAG: DUF3034 family protein [Betaproteobacteria bacterium]|nr:DUF3034 family protein [Betaproteobacteria bacterium]